MPPRIVQRARRLQVSGAARCGLAARGGLPRRPPGNRPDIRRAPRLRAGRRRAAPRLECDRAAGPAIRPAICRGAGLSLWLVVDVSASMRFGPERSTKADRAAQAAALLATAAIQNGDRAGLILVSDRIELELAPAGGVRHLSQLVRALVATPTSSPKTRLSVGLARVRRTARRAMLVVISDFVTEEPVGSWRRVARRHDTIALRVVDPREEQAARRRTDRPRRRRGGPDSPDRLELDQGQKRYETAALERSQAFQRWCANSGIQAFTMTTNVDPIVPLIELFSKRATRRGAR